MFKKPDSREYRKDTDVCIQRKGLWNLAPLLEGRRSSSSRRNKLHVSTTDWVRPLVWQASDLPQVSTMQQPREKIKACLHACARGGKRQGEACKRRRRRLLPSVVQVPAVCLSVRGREAPVSILKKGILGEGVMKLLVHIFYTLISGLVSDFKRVAGV